MKGYCDKRFSQRFDVKETPQTFGRVGRCFFIYVKKLLLVEMVFCDLIYKSDNACKHNYELKKFGKCHRYHLP